MTAGVPPPDELPASQRHLRPIKPVTKEAPHSSIVEFNRMPHHRSTLLEYEIHSVDLIDNSLRIQRHQIDQYLKDMHRHFHQSRGDGQVNPIFGQSPFIQDIQEEPIPTNFRLPLLEVFDGTIDLVEHVITF